MVKFQQRGDLRSPSIDSRSFKTLLESAKSRWRKSKNISSFKKQLLHQPDVYADLNL